MAVLQKFNFSWPVGTQPITLDEWARSLSESEYNEFLEAKERQKSYRHQAIASGRMFRGDKSYVWKDAEEAKKNKPSDPIWVRYFQRYLVETNTIFTMKFEDNNE